MKTVKFNSNFKEDINEFLKYKMTLGYKCRTLAIKLKKFDDFCSQEFPRNKFITEKLIDKWCLRKENESNNTYCDRIYAVRNLAIFINEILEKPAYIIPEEIERRDINRRNKYVFTEDDLKRIFKVIDNNEYGVSKHYREQTYRTLPVLLRVVFCCGLRIGEALGLTISDVDLERGILYVIDAKTVNSKRAVPMSLELTQLCRKYSEKCHKNSSENNPFFYNFSYDKPYPYPTISDTFDLILEKANIYKGAPYSRATLHSFRHTFIILRIRDWMREKKDFSVYQLVLLRYLGHKSFEETMYYFELTQMLYPDIRETIENYVGEVFPSLEVDEEKTKDRGGTQMI